MLSNLKKFNANPWGRRINDCVIRALVLGLGISYKAACRELHVAYRDGYGLIRDTGIDLEDIKQVFKPYFGEVIDFGETDEEIPPEQLDSDLDAFDIENGIDPCSSGLTLSDFIEMHQGLGRFLVNLVDPIGDGHIVFVNCQPGKNFAVDTFNSLNLTVNAWMQIKKTIPSEDPRHYKLDPVTKKLLP